MIDSDGSHTGAGLDWSKQTEAVQVGVLETHLCNSYSGGTTNGLGHIISA